MQRNLKILGLALAAVLAMSAVAASAASAASFHSEVEVTEITGTQTAEQVFEVNGGKVKCTVGKFAGKATGTKTAGPPVTYTVSTITVHPEYSGCTAFGLAATVNTGTATKGCNYVLSASSATAGRIDEIECKEFGGIVITVTSTGCTITVPAQTFPVATKTGVVDYKNEGATNTRDVLVTSTVGAKEGVTPIKAGATDGIKYVSSNEASVCGKSGENGAYMGPVTVKGYSDTKHEVQVGVWVE